MLIIMLLFLLKPVGIYLSTFVFLHDQLYVFISSVTSREELELLVINEDSDDTNVTSNLVFREVFENL